MKAGLLTSLASLATTLGVAAADDGDADVEKAARDALRKLAEQRATWLLVYDNVTSPEEIADFLPGGGAHLLITSRFSDWSGWAEDVSLDVLALEDAVGFLQARSGRKDEVGARLLAEALGCLPLALDHAGAFCRRTHVSFADYAAKASTLLAQVPRGSGYPRSVSATFDLAIGEAVAQCPAAEVVMAFLSQCPPRPIWMLLVRGAIGDETEHLAAIATLSEMSLIKHEPLEDGTAAIAVHRLVHAASRQRAESLGLAENAWQLLLARLGVLYPEMAKQMALEGQEAPHNVDALVVALLEARAACRGLRYAGMERAESYFVSRGEALPASLAKQLEENEIVRDQTLHALQRLTGASEEALSQTYVSLWEEKYRALRKEKGLRPD